MKQQWRLPILCIAAAAFLVFHQYVDLTNFFGLIFPSPNLFHPARGLYHRLISGCTAFLVLGILPIGAGCLLWNENPSQFGLTLGPKPLKKTLFLLVCLLISLPIIVYASSIPSFAAGHPASVLAARYPKAFILYEAGVLFFLLGWELFFRGFLLFGLQKDIGNAAIYVLIIPAALLGLRQNLLEAVAAIPAAIFLGHLAIETKSVWYGFLLHWVCILSLDLFIIYRPL